MRFFLAAWWILTGGIGGIWAHAQEPEIPFNEVPLTALSDRNFSVLGQAALSIHPNDWKHAETPHFVYHYTHSFIAAPVSVEAEFYYHVIAQELGKDTTAWERKGHIYVFESPQDWAQFQVKGALDPWTGGLHAEGSLFIQRNPEYKYKGNTLAHEITHLVIDRFYGSGVPLWLNEGYAEYSASRCYAAFNRARGFWIKPTSHQIPEGLYVPVATLTSMMTYPRENEKVVIFYYECERLTRFLVAANKPGFAVFLDALAHGSRLENALSKGFSGRFINLDSLDREFKSYATQQNGVSLAP